MKAGLAIAAISLLAAADAGSASAEVVYHGAFVITSASGCQDIHHQVNATNSRPSAFHPRVPGTNQDWTGLSVMFQFGGEGYRLDRGDFTSQFKVVTSGGLGWAGPAAWPAAQIKIVRQEPTTITASTMLLQLEGEIINPGNDAAGVNCTIHFTAGYTCAGPVQGNICTN